MTPARAFVAECVRELSRGTVAILAANALRGPHVCALCRRGGGPWPIPLLTTEGRLRLGKASYRATGLPYRAALEAGVLDGAEVVREFALVGTTTTGFAAGERRPTATA